MGKIISKSKPLLTIVIAALMFLVPGTAASAADPLLDFDPVSQSIISGHDPIFSPQPVAVGDTLHGMRGGGWPWPLPTLTYAWLRDAEVIPNSNSLNYLVQEADAGHHLSFRITGSQDGYNDLVSTSAPTGFLVMPDYTISGVMKVGKTVSVTLPNIAGLTFKYQWYAVDTFLLAGATKPTFTIPDSLAGASYLNVQVSAYQGETLVGQRLKTGDFTGAVTGGKNKPVSFKTAISSRMMATGGDLSGRITGENQGADCTRQWLRDGKTSLVGYGGSNENYRIVAADVGHSIVFKVTCSLFGRLGGTTKSSTKPKIVKGPLDVGSSSIDGTPEVGQTLSVNSGIGWTTGVTFSYQWLKDGKKIPGATSSSYVLPTQISGHRISLTLTAKKAGYDSASTTTSRLLVG